MAALATEGRLELRGFGVFEVRVTKARKARNPWTGLEIMAPERRWVKFKAGKVMKAYIVNGATAGGKATAPVAAGSTATGG
ncbi:MAG: HU family DNA-binding protein [Planctomycetota bacterium]|nr:HU family DNA-binding protein [Planctomycetota bacterium]